MGDDDELRVFEEVLDDEGEAFGVGFVEGGVDLVEEAEGAGLALEDGHEEGDGGHGFFAAGEEGDGLKLFSGGAGDDFDAAFEDVVGVFEDDFGTASAEEFAEEFGEVFADDFKVFTEEMFAFVVDLGDELFELFLGVGQVGQLRGEVMGAGFEFFLFGDGVEVDVAEAFDFGFEVVDFGGDGVPVHFLVLVVAEAFGEIEAYFFVGALGEVFAAEAVFAKVHLGLVDVFLKLLHPGLGDAGVFDEVLFFFVKFSEFVSHGTAELLVLLAGVEEFCNAGFGVEDGALGLVEVALGVGQVGAEGVEIVVELLELGLDAGESFAEGESFLLGLAHFDA